MNLNYCRHNHFLTISYLDLDLDRELLDPERDLDPDLDLDLDRDPDRDLDRDLDLDLDRDLKDAMLQLLGRMTQPLIHIC